MCIRDSAGCVRSAPGQVDASYVARLRNLIDAMPAGFKVMLFAFDQFHDETGRPQPERSAFYVPDAYARRLVKENAQAFEWVASIHPYRADALDALDLSLIHILMCIRDSLYRCWVAPGP